MPRSRRGRPSTPTTAATPAPTPAPAPAPTAAPTPATGAKRKLSYKEQRELEQLPATIEALEAEQKAIQAELADGSIYAKDGIRAAQLHQRDGEIEEALLEALMRWEELSA